jgi:hypothetical protein
VAIRYPTSVGGSVQRWHARGEGEGNARRAPVVQNARLDRSCLDENITMKFEKNISLICVASAANLSYYNDASCGTASKADDPNQKQ